MTSPHAGVVVVVVVGGGGGEQRAVNGVNEIAQLIELSSAHSGR